MENLDFFLLLTSILVLSSLIGVLVLIFSPTSRQLDQENVKKEEQLKYKIRRKEAAKKAALEYLLVIEKKDHLKISYINNIPINKKNDTRVVDLRERHGVQKQRTKRTI